MQEWRQLWAVALHAKGGAAAHTLGDLLDINAALAGKGQEGWVVVEICTAMDEARKKRIEWLHKREVKTT